MFIHLVLMFTVSTLFAQSNALDFYLPRDKGYTYNKDIPTPAEVLGFEIGDQHVTYDQALYYIRTLAQKSNRAVYQESGRSYEYKPLGFLTISSAQNIAGLEEIRKEHLNLCNPSVSEKSNLEKMPVVIYLTYSVHGNEASGINASLAVAYFLAAAQGEEIERILQNSVIIIQPAQNPDGSQKFATWVNSSRSFTPVADNNSQEFKEPYYPSSRSNHYWFDLNRDWLTVQHPESRGRMAFYYQWFPTVVGDFHEHGSTNGAYFSPGISTSIDKNIPADNYKWTQLFGKYHGDTLSSIGTVYFSKEGYDDFFTGKGAALPDLHGAVAMLFEQPASRGHIQKRNGVLLKFSEQIQNQAYCSYSTIKAALDNRVELLKYQKDSYKETVALAKNDPVKGYIFGDNGSLDGEFLNILRTHRIKVHRLAKDFSKDGKNFSSRSAYVVSTAQPEYRTVKTIFEKEKEYIDSTFYDISTWTLPLAMHLKYAELGGEAVSLAGEELLGNNPAENAGKLPEKNFAGDQIFQMGQYGYCFQLTDYYSYKLLYRLLEAGVEPRVATTSFALNINGKIVKFDTGTVVVYHKVQEFSKEDLYKLMVNSSKDVDVKIFPVHSGTGEKIDLGSKSFQQITLPKIAILCGNGAAASETGELWYLLDQKFSIPATMLDASKVATTDLSLYNVIVVNGNYKLGAKGVENLKKWQEDKSNYLIAINTALDLVNSLGKTELVTQKSVSAIEGVILQVAVNSKNPLCYGITTNTLPIFKNNKIILEPGTASGILKYPDTPLLSGCTKPSNVTKLKNTPAAVVADHTTYLSFAPFFRGYFFGSSRVFLNALFFRELL